MAQEELAGALYDYVYRDTGRITSYYAQLFGGLLKSSERTDADRQTKETAGKLDLQLFGGTRASTSSIETSLRNVSDPHDIIITDVLRQLVKDNRFHENVGNAPDGALVLEQGSLVFVDGSILRMASPIIEALLVQQRKKPRRERDEAALHAMEMVRGLLDKISVPSAYLFKTRSGVLVAGTLRDEGMVEPISMYHFKHGTTGLSGIYLVGIKEMPTGGWDLPSTPLIGASQQFAVELGKLVFPPEAIRLTPLAMFRKL